MAQFMRTFRKHRKAMLAVLTLMAMLSFVFLPTVLDMMQTGGRAQNPVKVKTTKYGSLTERQLEAIVRQRRRLFAFFRQLAEVVLAKGGRGEAIREALEMLGNSPANEEAAMDAWLQARKAEELGLKVSEKAINDYLASLTEGKAGSEDIRQILRRQKISQPQLFEGLRQEMLSFRLAQMFWISLAATTPAQRWEYYQQLNRRAKIEAVPVAAAKFVDKVPTPSEEVLREFFEKHKQRLPDPISPEPGFREPHRINVQYLKASVETFMDPAAVTEQAIRDRYEADKERLYKDVLPKLEPPKTEPPKSAPPKSEPPKSGAEKGKSAAPVPGKTSLLPRRSPFRLVSEQKTTPQSPDPKGEPTTPKAEPTTAKSTPPAAKMEPAAPKAEPPAAKTEPKGEPKGAISAVPAASAPAPVKYKPLGEVKDEIRKTLAREAAQDKIQEVLRRLEDRLRQFEMQWTLYDTLEPEKKDTTPPPARPDFVALAKENRLTAAETGLMSALQMSGADIGRSRVEGRAAFTEVAYEKSVPLFRPGTSQDSEGHSYLFWKVADSPERVPEMDEPAVRQQVVDAWKLVQARDLATKEAERLAAEARSAKKSLAGLAAARKDLQVITPEPFTWLTFGNVPVWFRMRPPQYSEVTGISGAGTDFMRGVFALKPGEIGLATDQPKSTIYVVRLVEYTPIDSVLWDLFVNDDYRGYAMAGRYDQMVAVRLWREGIRTEAGLDWVRQPFRGRGEVDE